MQTPPPQPSPQPSPSIQADGTVASSPPVAVSPSPQQTKTVPITYQLQFQAVSITSILVNHDEQWLAGQHDLVETLKQVWASDTFHSKYIGNEAIDYSHWKEPKLLAKCLLNYFQQNPSDIELLFQLLRAFMGRYLCDFDFLRDFLENTVASNYTIEWKRQAFFKFVEIFHNQSYPLELKAKILQYIIVPAFSISFERGEGEKLIGGPPAPEHDNADNLISVFINRVIDPDNPFGMSDSVRILLLQFSCLLVEQASPHIHDAANKRQGNKLRRLMTFAWPCLLAKNCVDPATKYHGHLLLAHIIAKFAIHKRIVLQVFHSLLKAFAVEARTVVRQALEILTPAMPQRMEDGNTMLTHWTKKIIVEEGHTLAQLVHMLQLLVRHYNVYYPVRHHLIQHMVTSVQRLGFTPNATIEHKKIAVDLVEVIIRWEFQRLREEQDQTSTPSPMGVDSPTTIAQRPVPRATPLPSVPGIGKPMPVDSNKPIDKIHSDSVVNFLLRLACHVNETATNVGSNGEMLSRRCVNLLKNALKVWPNSDLKLQWFDKLLATVEQPQPNFGNICTALELLCFLLNILRKELVLTSFKPLQRGIALCMTCNNSKVIRSVHNLLSRLMNMFPPEPTTSNVASKHDELDSLYQSVNKTIHDGLNNYEKNTGANPSSLFSTLMILKAACLNNPCYIDRLITPFMRVLQKMARDHLQPPAQQDCNVPMATELLILSLDLVKNRIGVMGQEMRKAFIQTILVGLIEKSTDPKVMKAITKMVEDWVKNKGPFGANQAPVLREKALLLVRMMQHIEKRFPDDLELNAHFLELINYVYREETLKNSDLTPKLEQAFMAGLRCVQPHIRAKFFEVYDASMRRRLHERLMYIVCSQNWETIGQHFWIKQCIELLMITAVNTMSIQSANPSATLPSVTSVISLGDQQERASFANISSEMMDVDVSPEKEDEDMVETLDLGATEETRGSAGIGLNDPLTSSVLAAGGVRRPSTPLDPKRHLQEILLKQIKFLEGLRETRVTTFLTAMSQLCHMDTSLAQHIWIQMFPRIYKILSDRQQNLLGLEVVPFLCSGSHVIQKDHHPSAIGTFMESVALCSPPITIRPCLLRYLGKSHNLWHRAALLLEHAFEKAGALTALTSAQQPKTTRASAAEDQDSVTIPSLSQTQESLDALADIYELLKEEDLWSGLWQKRAKYNETMISIAFEQQGYFEQSQGAYELAMTKARNDYNVTPAPVWLQAEYKLWERHWIKCSKELNQWDLLLDYGNAKGCANPFLVLESAWRVPNWPLMKDSLFQVEANCPKDMAWKVALYKGYNAICNPEEHNLAMVDKMVELSTNLCIKEWRRLPHVVSQAHIVLLQAAQQIMELQEAGQIHQGLLPNNIGRTSSLHDMKAIVKTWRNRLPVLADDLSHWSDIFTWRQHHYQAIVSHYDTNNAIQNAANATAQAVLGAAQTDPQTSHAMLGVHASAQSIIHYGKIARKHNLVNVCLDSLNRIHTIPSVPLVDCFQKIRQQVKCYLQLSNTLGKNELQEGLEVIESTNLKYFSKEMTAEFYALKGMFLAQIGRLDEANKAFSAAAQMHDTLVKAWALWGDYLDSMFTRDKWDSRQMEVGVSALTCYLHACRHQNESKARKYLAKVLWLLSYDDEKTSLAEAVEKYNVGVPPNSWLPWVPQLMTCLVRNEGNVFVNIVTHVGRVFPQAVYFPIRTLYLTLKMEQREKLKTMMGAAQGSQSTISSQGSDTSGESQPSSVPQQPNQSQPTPQQAMADQQYRATRPMWRCSRIMHMQRELHPTTLSSLEGIVDQMVWFRENWYEEVLRQLRQALAKCYAVAFENRANVAEAQVTQNTLNFVKKLVSTFGIGIENVSSSQSAPNTATAASESLARRAQATAQDPVFQKMKGQFTQDFDFNSPGAMKLHNLITKLKKWIKILEAKTKLLPKSLLIEEKCKILSNFSQQTADVELPGEFLLPKQSNYYVRIARFMPRVEIVSKHNTAARRLYIRGHNGKIYPYLVVNDSCLSDARREERVLQLERLLNHYLAKQKETAKRFLNFTVPRVVAVSPQMRLVEDNCSSISLLEIYKQRNQKRNIEHDQPIAKYYDRLASVQARGSQASHQVLRDILKDIQTTMIPVSLIKEWAAQTFPSATDLWTFRKQVCGQRPLNPI